MKGARIYRQIEAAENARKARKKQSNKILKIEGILYVKDARSMTQDRQKLKDERQQQREEAWEKRYLNALKKCYRATKPHRAPIGLLALNLFRLISRNGGLF